MFRNRKFSETTPSKQSRSRRFLEMSKQRQLIEQKKREIQARFEEKKKKIDELTGENKSQQPLAITKNAMKLDKIKSSCQKSRSIKKNETSTKGSNEKLLYKSTGAHKNKPSLAEVFENNISVLSMVSKILYVEAIKLFQEVTIYTGSLVF